MPNAKNAEVSSKRKILLLGDTGTGKTSQITTLPGRTFAYLFDPNAILSLSGHDVDYEEFYADRLNLSVKSLTKGKGDSNSTFSSKVFYDWEINFQKKIEEGFFDNYENIVFDSATTFLDLIMDRVLTINGRAGSWPQQDDYGPQMQSFVNVCRTLTSLNKVVFMTGHVELKKDELAGRIFREPMMTGKLKKKIPLLFSDIFVTEVEADGRGGKKHRIMTIPDRITTSVRTSVKGLQAYEDVTIDWSKPPVGQGLAKVLKMV